MRTIKFRALCDGLLFEMTDGMSLNGFFEAISWYDDVVLEQFTGLLDKNGEEIYEGDHDAEGLFVVFCDRCHGWQFGLIDIPTKEIVIDCQWCYGNFGFDDYTKDFEITGNIHEKCTKKN